MWPLHRTDMIKHDLGYAPPDGTFGGDSTYVNDFRRYNQQPVGLIKPGNGPVQSNEPFIDSTSHKEDYIRHNLPPKFYKAKEEYQRNQIPLESLTTSHRDFTAKDIEKIRSYKPDNIVKGPEAPMESDTTSKSDFKRWSVEPVTKRPGAEWIPPTSQMENNTSYSTDFTHRSSQRVQALKPMARDKTLAKFEGDPVYKCNFSLNIILMPVYKFIYVVMWALI